jgi:hypothetical protein
MSDEHIHKFNQFESYISHLEDLKEAYLELNNNSELDDKVQERVKDVFISFLDSSKELLEQEKSVDPEKDALYSYGKHLEGRSFLTIKDDLETAKDPFLKLPEEEGKPYLQLIEAEEKEIEVFITEARKFQIEKIAIQKENSVIKRLGKSLDVEDMTEEDMTDMDLYDIRSDLHLTTRQGPDGNFTSEKRSNFVKKVISYLESRLHTSQNNVFKNLFYCLRQNILTKQDSYLETLNYVVRAILGTEHKSVLFENLDMLRENNLDDFLLEEVRKSSEDSDYYPEEISLDKSSKNSHLPIEQKESISRLHYLLKEHQQSYNSQSEKEHEKKVLEELYSSTTPETLDLFIEHFFYYVEENCNSFPHPAPELLFEILKKIDPQAMNSIAHFLVRENNLEKFKEMINLDLFSDVDDETINKLALKIALDPYSSDLDKIRRYPLFFESPKIDDDFFDNITKTLVERFTWNIHQGEDETGVSDFPDQESKIIEEGRKDYDENLDDNYDGYDNDNGYDGYDNDDSYNKPSFPSIPYFFERVNSELLNKLSKALFKIENYKGLLNNEILLKKGGFTVEEINLLTRNAIKGSLSPLLFKNLSFLEKAGLSKELIEKVEEFNPLFALYGNYDLNDYEYEYNDEYNDEYGYESDKYNDRIKNEEISLQGSELYYPDERDADMDPKSGTKDSFLYKFKQKMNARDYIGLVNEISTFKRRELPPIYVDDLAKVLIQNRQINLLIDNLSHFEYLGINYETTELIVKTLIKRNDFRTMTDNLIHFYRLGLKFEELELNETQVIGLNASFSCDMPEKGEEATSAFYKFLIDYAFNKYPLVENIEELNDFLRSSVYNNPMCEYSNEDPSLENFLSLRSVEEKKNSLYTLLSNRSSKHRKICYSNYLKDVKRFEIKNNYRANFFLPLLFPIYQNLIEEMEGSDPEALEKKNLSLLQCLNALGNEKLKDTSYQARLITLLNSLGKRAVVIEQPWSLSKTELIDYNENVSVFNKDELKNYNLLIRFLHPLLKESTLNLPEEAKIDLKNERTNFIKGLNALVNFVNEDALKNAKKDKKSSLEGGWTFVIEIPSYQLLLDFVNSSEKFLNPADFFANQTLNLLMGDEDNDALNNELKEVGEWLKENRFPDDDKISPEEAISKRLKETFFRENASNMGAFFHYFSERINISADEFKEDEGKDIEITKEKAEKSSQNVKTDIRRFIFSILKGDFHEIRYQTNHLETVESLQSGVLDSWKNNSYSEEITVNGKTLTLTESDDPEDLILVATDGPSSCQDIFKSSSLNTELLGYALKGKHKVLLIKNKEGNILARRIIRLIIQEDDQGALKPILMRETLYSKGGNYDSYLLDAYKKILQRLDIQDLNKHKGMIIMKDPGVEGYFDAVDSSPIKSTQEYDEYSYKVTYAHQNDY